MKFAHRAGTATLLFALLSSLAHKATPAEPTAPTISVAHVVEPQLSLEQVVRFSDRIVYGRVLDSITRLANVPVTDYRVEVLGRLHGPASTNLTLTVAGGELDDQVLIVPTAPKFEAGDEVVLFCAGEPDLGLVSLGRAAYRVTWPESGPAEVRGHHAKQGTRLEDFLGRVEAALVARKGGAK